MKLYFFSAGAFLAAAGASVAQENGAETPASVGSGTPADFAEATLSLLELLGRGGPVMWLLGALAFFTTVLVLVLLFSVRRGAFVSSRFMSVSEALLRKRDITGLLAVANRHSEATAEVVRRVLDFETHHPQATPVELRQIAEAEGGRHASALNQRVALLADVATLAPMLGLLGTVVGIIRSFGVLSQNLPQSSSLVLAGGVAEALVTTGVGLLIGILAAMFYGIFRGRAQRIVSEFESAVAQLVGAVSMARHPRASTASHGAESFSEDF